MRARARARARYICTRLVRTRARMYIRGIVRVQPARSSCPFGLPPRSTGQWLAASALLRSTPDSLLRFVRSPVLSLPLARPRSHPHLLPVHFSSSALCVRPFASLRSFVRSFVRVTLGREHPGVSETSMRDSSSFLVSLSVPVSFRSSVPAPTRSLLSFPRLVPSPFQSGAFPRLTGIFGATPFRYR